MTAAAAPLRLVSHLAPSVPTGLFEAVACHLRTHLGRPVDLTFDTTRSGPGPGEDEPFRDGGVDVAFVCATSYVWLTAPAQPAIDLLGAAWVPTDPRAGGRPVYFGDVVAAASGPRSLAALAGRRVAFNDHVSLSGLHCLRLALADAGVETADVEFVRSGSHLRSLELLTTGRVDAAAIDSNVWRRRCREDPGLSRTLAPVASLGPHPAQPVVTRRGLPPDVRATVTLALLDAHRQPRVADALDDAELSHFAPVTPDDYATLRDQMAAGVP